MTLSVFEEMKFALNALPETFISMLQVHLIFSCYTRLLTHILRP